VLARTQQLCHSLIEAGGDPLAGLDAGADPLRTLRREVQAVQLAQTPATVAPLLALQAAASGLVPTGPDGLRAAASNTVLGQESRQRLPGERLDLGRSRRGRRNNARRLHAPAAAAPRAAGRVGGAAPGAIQFEVFAPGTINFGINVTYRQCWEPITYQVGNLVKTITLAPKESRKVSTKVTRRKERVVRELENNLRVRKDESSDTARDEAEIVRKAQGKTTFSLTAQGSFDIGIADGDSTTSFTKDASTDSADVKKAFREAVIRRDQQPERRAHGDLPVL
jgi:hypothetical protein